MGALIEAHISPCPQCGQDRWLMDIPEDIARKKHAKRAELTAGQAFRRGAVIGAVVTLGGVLGRILFWHALQPGRVCRPISFI